MNLAIDIGNTALKWGAFEGGRLTASGQGLDTAPLDRAARTLACASGSAAQLPPSVPLLSARTPMPIGVDYRTPLTLGPDRLAAACGAWALHPGEPCLVIDAGTCITADLLAPDGRFRGGAIMPGLRMNLQALHTFTDKLPLIDFDETTRVPLPGRSTEECILAGTLMATVLALAGYVVLYRDRYPALRVLLTGGDAPRLADAGHRDWELVPNLTLAGLDAIMTHGQ